MLDMKRHHCVRHENAIIVRRKITNKEKIKIKIKYSLRRSERNSLLLNVTQSKTFFSFRTFTSIRHVSSISNNELIEADNRFHVQ